MGRLLEEYIASNVPALENIVRGGIQQPEGATTFPGPDPGPPLQGQPIGPGGAPTGPMAALPGPGGISPGAAATPSFDAAAGAPKPAIPPVEAQAQPDRSGEFEPGPDSFAGMSETASPEDINSATTALEKALEAKGTNIDEEHAKVTGGKVEKSEDDPEGKSKGEGLTRQEKGLILMEFGLNLMAQSGTGEGTLAGDIGIAGGAALKGHVGRKQAKAKGKIAAEEREQKKRLTEAQIAKAERPDTAIKTDKSGQMVIINKDTQEATPILMDGEPVEAANAEKFASEVDRQAYESLECEGLTGAAMKACKRRALAYGKGGGAKVAFPELERADQVDRVMRNLEDPDKASSKYTIPSTGEAKRWKAMSPDEQLEVAESFVERRMTIINKNKGDIQTDAPKPGPAQNWFDQLDPETQKGMVAGKIYTLSNDRKIRKRDGKWEEVK